MKNYYYEYKSEYLDFKSDKEEAEYLTESSILGWEFFYRFFDTYYFKKRVEL